MTTASLARQIGNAVKEAARSRRLGWWYGPHMAAATRAIAERIPLVDLVLEVRDARIPLSSAYGLLRDYPSSSRRIIVLNKMDLANHLQTKEWMKYFELRSCTSYGVNSHNKENIKEFLNFLNAQVRELMKYGQNRHTITVMILGIPNVGKSALANSLHQIGRISAAEKGKLKHATVSPAPGETKDISSLKIGSHPNIYILDTPGILPPEIGDVEVCSKLALTGAIRDCLAGEKGLAQYFLAILNSSEEYKRWENLSCSSVDKKHKGQYSTDHTQDFVVHNVRRTLFQIVSSSVNNLVDGKDLEGLIEAQLTALREAFHVPVELGEDALTKVAAKLLNLYRTGRLGHYILDPVPENFL